MIKKKLWWLLIPGILLVLVIVVLAGPRVSTKVRISEIPLSARLLEYLDHSDAAFADIVPGTEKHIVWAGETEMPTPTALVFLHGFSGSRQELVPLMDIVAGHLGANLYYNRYSGHGRGPEAMAEPSLQDWVDDTLEALAIGWRQGSRVVVVGMSTAASLLAWLCTQDVCPDALVMISPNFGPADPKADLVLLPWGRLIVKLVVGDYNEYEVISERHAKYTTPRYRSEALLTMMAAVELGRRADLERVRVPLLCLSSILSRNCPPHHKQREQRTKDAGGMRSTPRRNAG